MLIVLIKVKEKVRGHEASRLFAYGPFDSIQEIQEYIATNLQHTETYHILEVIPPR